MKIKNNFNIGASISSWQYEGSMVHKNKNFIENMYELDSEHWFEGYGPQNGCDFFKKMKDDVAKFREIGLESIRLTIDWSRFINDLKLVTINYEYADFYLDFIKELLDSNIEPIIILEHWDLPVEFLNEFDGYSSTKIVGYFTKYAEEVFKYYNGYVKKWLTFNEPIVIPQQCYMQKMWYPYETNLKKAIKWMHVKNLCSASVVKRFRELEIEGIIGIGGLNVELVKVKDPNNVADLEAGKIAQFFFEKKFLYPAIKGHYDYEYLQWLEEEGLSFDFSEDEENLIKENTVDFIGINYYHPGRVQAPLENDDTAFGKYFSEYHDPTVEYNLDRGWEVNPEVLYDIAYKLKNEYNNILWFVNENGYGCVELDKKRDQFGRIIDDYRIEFINRHLYYLTKAVNEGCNCFGYHIWSAIDNLSPYNAFKNRYGYIEVDLNQDYKRMYKLSAQYINDVINTREVALSVDIDKYIRMDNIK